MNACARLLLPALLCLSQWSAADIDTASLDALHMQRLEEQAPDFDLPSVTGERQRLAALLGQPVILHFWATWCTSCRKELPQIQALQGRLTGSDVQLLVVAIDDDASPEAIRDYAASLGITLPVLLASGGTISERYWTWGVPATYFIDREGRIAARAMGPRDWNAAPMRALLDQFAAR